MIHLVFICIQSLIDEGKAMMVATGTDAIWQVVRVMRCARSMLIQVGGDVFVVLFGF